MKSILLSLLSLTALVQANEEKKEVPRKEFGDSKVLIGKLGVPFGTIVRVTCRSFEPGEEDMRKGDPWKRQVEITSIGGKPVDPPIRIDWGIPKGIQKPPLGGRVEVWAYETGSFRGLPDGLDKYSDAIPQDHSFCFVNQLLVIRKVTPGDPAQ